MGFTFDNQTLLYIIIALFIVQIFVMRYYVQSSIEASQQDNNKKLIKRLTGQIGSTFEQYMGNQNKQHQIRQEMVSDPKYSNIRGEMGRRSNRNQDMDSINDPADDVDDGSHDYTHDYPQDYPQDDSQIDVEEPQDNDSYE